MLNGLRHRRARRAVWGIQARVPGQPAAFEVAGETWHPFVASPGTPSAEGGAVGRVLASPRDGAPPFPPPVPGPRWPPQPPEEEPFPEPLDPPLPLLRPLPVPEGVPGAAPVPWPVRLPFTRPGLEDLVQEWLRRLREFQRTRGEGDLILRRKALARKLWGLLRARLDDVDIQVQLGTEEGLNQARLKLGLRVLRSVEEDVRELFEFYLGGPHKSDRSMNRPLAGEDEVRRLVGLVDKYRRCALTFNRFLDALEDDLLPPPPQPGEEPRMPVPLSPYQDRVSRLLDDLRERAARILRRIRRR